MTVDIEAGIRWMQAKKGKVYYDMGNRNGPNSYDCSSAIYYALRSAGASDNGWAVSTESEHDWLKKNGYVLIAENKAWEMKRGDIIIWGVHGYSSGADGHTMMALDGSNVIHCTWNDGVTTGIMINTYNQVYSWSRGRMGGPYAYVYRLPQANNNNTNETKEKGEFNMEFTFSVKDDSSFLPGVYFYNSGTNTYRHLNHPDEWTILREIYKATHSGQDMPHKEWSKQAPWHARFLDATGATEYKR